MTCLKLKYPSLIFLLLLLGCTNKDHSNTYKVNLTKEKISETPDDLVEQLVLDYILANVDQNADELDWVGTLNPAHRALYVTWLVEAEVNNGGFNQFYFNSSGQVAQYGEESFRTFGANRYADLMHRANLTYDSIKADLEQYNDGTVESFSKSYENNPLNKLDDEFYKLGNDESLTHLRAKYIKSHIGEFAIQ